MNKDGILAFILVFSESVVSRAHGPPVCLLFKVCCCCLIFLLSASVLWIFSYRLISAERRRRIWWAPVWILWFWGTSSQEVPVGLRAKFVAPEVLYTMVYPFGQDHTWTRSCVTFSLRFRSSTEWKSSVFGDFCKSTEQFEIGL